ncbi:hypothetical protein RBWH47_02451 [Rhodopirellula baltica WH47]|uniref:Uncharacterized protein n=1 Tax=Rhodopirellula baltica WH47 TaxID=991778 RepID=F2B1Q5_RHOBT|nr:hypothetical protein RBWH47_02451 [Rhodopirellula baltica WH47]
MDDTNWIDTVQVRELNCDGNIFETGERRTEAALGEDMVPKALPISPAEDGTGLEVFGR